MSRVLTSIDRVAVLEKRLQSTQRVLAITLAMGAFAACVAATSAPSEILRARGIVIVDQNGVERIQIGAPVPSGTGEGGVRRSAATGITMHGPDGRERLGLAMFDDGTSVLGFDAAPGVGAGSNRERLHLGVDPNGRGFVRYLDQDSGLAGQLLLNNDDQLELEFWGKAKGGRRPRSVIDLSGWRQRPDYIADAKEK